MRHQASTATFSVFPLDRLQVDYSFNIANTENVFGGEEKTKAHQTVNKKYWAHGIGECAVFDFYCFLN